jgi:zinc protease
MSSKSPSAPLTLPHVPVRRETLPNGLTVLMLTRPDLPIVSLNLLLRAGLCLEKRGEEGLAQLTTSLLSHGTRRRSATQLAEDIDSLGASLGVNSDRDFASVGLSAAADDVDAALEILAEVATQPAFAPEELERRRSDTLSALRRREDDLAYRVARRFTQRIFGEHPYRNPSLGLPEVVEAIRREQVVSFYEQGFLPNNAVLAVVGAFDSDRMLRDLERRFAEWRPGTLPEPTFPPIPEPRERVIETIQKDEVVQATIRMGRVAIPRNHPDHVPLMLMNFALGGSGFGSRLMQRLRENGGLTYGAYSSVQEWRLAGALGAACQTSLPNLNEAVHALIEEIEQVRQAGITEEELAWARSYFTGSLPLSFQTNDQIASLVLVQELFGLPHEYWLQEIEQVRTCPLSEVNRCAQTYLDTGRFAIVILSDFRKHPLEL